MEKQHKIGLGAFALLLGAVYLAVPSQPTAPAEPVATAQANRHLAAVTPSARRDIDYAALDARLKRMAEKPAVVGLAVGVVENGRITFLSGYGETLAGSGEKVTPDTVFRWASVSKGVAATMIAKLAEEDKLSFNSPLAKYASIRLPGGAESRATIGDLLSHRLGLYRNAYDNKLEEGQDTRFLRQTLGHLNLICPPGTCWSYQNVAYDGSSEIVERVTGKPFREAVREKLFNPIGMTSASVTREGLVSAKSWARPHNAGRKPLEVLDTYYRVPAAGGVNSNIKDLALWMLAQMGQMPDVLSPQLLHTIHAPLVKTPGERRRLRKFLERLGQADYGYGWRSYDYAGHRIVGHRGGVSGYRSLILFDPDRKSGVVAMWNSNTNQPGGLEFEVMDMLYRLPFRDWMELGNGAPGAAPDNDDEAAKDSAAIAAARTTGARGSASFRSSR
ncbi:serine hydrolase domain-containing protein [Sphingomonas sp.]|uniref:serine hydrolase domain-containing protein n=1 Tax=Sphingomonas sp. TaxID=28214 RepID=UPI00180CA99C|nr:serine hydrolase domain-containing protein [Sphingomonas sp.]MBA3510951.1 beta-lactamase family protein [Sphingomonas sp.]